jgi:hypothetical protein
MATITIWCPKWSNIKYKEHHTFDSEDFRRACVHALYFLWNILTPWLCLPVGWHTATLCWSQARVIPFLPQWVQLQAWTPKNHLISAHENPLSGYQSYSSIFNGTSLIQAEKCHVDRRRKTDWYADSSLCCNYLRFWSSYTRIPEVTDW